VFREVLTTVSINGVSSSTTKTDIVRSAHPDELKDLDLAQQSLDFLLVRFPDQKEKCAPMDETCRLQCYDFVFVPVVCSVPTPVPAPAPPLYSISAGAGTFTWNPNTGQIEQTFF